MISYGYEEEIQAEQSTKVPGLKHGELVRCMIIRKVESSKKYLADKKAYDEDNAILAESGMPVEDYPYSVKKYGITYQVAVLKRNMCEINPDGSMVKPYLPVIGYSEAFEGEIDLPEFSATFYVNQESPIQIYNPESKTGGFHVKGGSFESEESKPNIVHVLPNTYPAKNAVDEQKRQRAIERIIEQTEKATEEEAEALANLSLAKKLLICSIDLEKSTDTKTVFKYYYENLIGAQFNALIERSGKYANLVTFKYNGDFTYSLYSNIDSRNPTMLDVELAHNISAAIQRKVEAYLASVNNNLPEKAESPEDDEVPF